MTSPSDNPIAKRLYELPPEIIAAGQALSDFYDLPEAEQDPEAEGAMFAAWKGLMLGLEAKVEACALVLNEGDLWADGVRSEIARLTAMLDRAEKKMGWLKEYMRSNMAAAGVKVVEGNRIGVRRVKNPPRVVIAETAPEDARTYLPDFLVTEKHTYTPDKKAILAAWKATGKLPQYVDVHEGEHLRIK